MLGSVAPTATGRRRRGPSRHRLSQLGLPSFAAQPPATLVNMAVAALRRHRASPPRCRKHASRPSPSPAPRASGSRPVFTQVSVGKTTRGVTKTRQGHPLFGTRYYDPSVGRWTQQDPVAGSIADPGSVNRYAYVRCDPVNFTDPDGRSPLGAVGRFFKRCGRGIQKIGYAAAGFALFDLPFAAAHASEVAAGGATAAGLAAAKVSGVIAAAYFATACVVGHQGKHD